MSKQGIILETAVPVRKESADSSEMVNQLLFGEVFSILEEQEKWVHIKSSHDNYEGWIDRKQSTECGDSSINFQVVQSLMHIEHSSRGKVPITPGALIHKDLLHGFGFEAEIATQANPITLREACALFENAPYLWGGRTPFGIDCSGFTQLVYRLLGKSLPRDASQQVEQGTLVSFISEAQEGDLAFFDNAEGRITHVGIIMGDSDKHIIHASGRVRTDKIDHNGIFNEETQSYSHQLRTIKTIL